MSLHIFENLFAVYGFKNVAVFDKTNALFGCNTHIVWAKKEKIVRNKKFERKD